MAQRRLRCEISLLVVVLWLMLQGFGFKLESWHTGKRWPHYAQKIRAAETRVRTTGHYEVMHIEGAPEGFDFDLLINQTSARRNN